MFWLKDDETEVKLRKVSESSKGVNNRQYKLLMKLNEMKKYNLSISILHLYSSLKGREAVT